jgi:hypothetical protein
LVLPLFGIEVGRWRKIRSALETKECPGRALLRRRQVKLIPLKNIKIFCVFFAPGSLGATILDTLTTVSPNKVCP